MMISGNFPVLSQNSAGVKSNTGARTTTDQPSITNTSITSVPSNVEAFEQANASQSSRFFRMDGLSAMAQNALAAYQSTEMLSSSNPRNQLIGIDVYA